MMVLISPSTCGFILRSWGIQVGFALPEARNNLGWEKQCKGTTGIVDSGAEGRGD